MLWSDEAMRSFSNRNLLLINGMQESLMVSRETSFLGMEAWVLIVTMAEEI